MTPAPGRQQPSGRHAGRRGRGECSERPAAAEAECPGAKGNPEEYGGSPNSWMVYNGYLSIYLSIYLSVYLSIYLSIYT